MTHFSELVMKNTRNVLDYEEPWPEFLNEAEGFNEEVVSRIESVLFPYR